MRKKSSKELSAQLNLILCLLMSLGMLLAVMVSVNIFAPLTKNHMLLILTGKEKVANPLEDGRFKLMASVLQNIPLIGGIVLTVIHIWKKPLSELGLTSLKLNWKDALTGLLLGFAGITIALICLLASGSVSITSFTGSQYGVTIFLSFLSYILVAFGEEILARGGCMLALKPSHNRRLILLFPSIIFAAMHFGNEGVTPLAIINLTGFGLYASYCFYRSDNIWLPIGFHLTWNFVQGNVYGFHVSGTTNYSLVKMKIIKETIFTGGAFGPEGGLGVTIALIIMFVITYFYYKNRPASSFMTAD